MPDVKVTKAQREALLAAWDGPTGVVLMRGFYPERGTASKVVLTRLVDKGLLSWRPGQGWPAAKLTEEGYLVTAGLSCERKRSNA